MKVAIIIPTRNGGDLWQKTVTSISKQKKYNENIIIIDSNSSDETLKVANGITDKVIKIHENEFNHGSTRNLGCRYIEHDTDVVIFLTQDAVLASPDSLSNIVDCFQDASVAAAFGRQIPHMDATPIAKHARMFNYVENSYVSSMISKESMGIKTVFISNSFSAYRVSIFNELGGFPENTILCEDMYFAAKAVMKGYKIAYVSNAEVYHSHNYTPLEEFRRYFDIGVFHEKEPWIRNNFGGAGSEGNKFIISELRYLLKVKPSLIPIALFNNFMKLLGYKMGERHSIFSTSLKKKFSMHKNFWNDSAR